MRRVHLRGRENILKRVLIHLGGFHLSLVMRQLLGKGTPRGLQGASADVLLAFLRFWIAVLARTGQQGVPLPWLICSRARHIEILISLAAM
jgi:hypothetical protein